MYDGDVIYYEDEHRIARKHVPDDLYECGECREHSHEKDWDEVSFAGGIQRHIGIEKSISRELDNEHICPNCKRKVRTSEVTEFYPKIYLPW